MSVIDSVPFPYGKPISPQQRGGLVSAGRRAARSAYRKTKARDLPPSYGLTIFTDGLGGMGVGSWDDGPASIKQQAFNAEYRALYAADGIEW